MQARLNCKVKLFGSGGKEMAKSKSDLRKVLEVARHIINASAIYDMHSLFSLGV